MLISDNRAKVMETVIKAATEAAPILDNQGEVKGWVYGDMKAAELLWKADGTLPQAKGTSIILNQQNNTQMAGNEDDNSLPLAGMDSRLKEIQQILNAPQLPAPQQVVTVPVIEAEYAEISL